MEKNRKKEIIAAVIVTLLTIAYFAVYFGVIISLVEGIWRYLLAIVPLAISATLIGVCIDRIREIEKGEKDAASKY